MIWLIELYNVPVWKTIAVQMPDGSPSTSDESTVLFRFPATATSTLTELSNTNDNMSQTRKLMLKLEYEWPIRKTHRLHQVQIQTWQTGANGWNFCWKRNRRDHGNLHHSQHTRKLIISARMLYNKKAASCTILKVLLMTNKTPLQRK